jgi:hypothetical protein
VTAVSLVVGLAPLVGAVVYTVVSWRRQRRRPPRVAVLESRRESARQHVERP